jgi:N-methylhydantoinase A
VEVSPGANALGGSLDRFGFRRVRLRELREDGDAVRRVFRIGADVVEQVREGGAESVAICLLFSYLDPAHERALAERLRAELGGGHVSVSHEVLPQFREYERCSTTVIDAYLSPLLGRYLTRLAAACRERGLTEPLVMRSSGGTATAEEAARAGAWSVLSGPSGDNGLSIRG